MSASQRVLGVEDDVATREVLVEALRQLGYEVVEAASAGAASSRIDFDIALLDLHLPDGSGLGALKSWRERGVDAPVLIITADRAAEMIDRALVSLDAWDYLPKPFDLDALESTVRDAIARSIERRSIEKRLAG